MVLVPVFPGTFTLDPRDGRAVVVFRDAAGRQLPLWVDDVDAAALASAARGERDTQASAAALFVGALDACGGAVLHVELGRVERGVLRAVVVIDGARGPAELPAKASVAAAIALLAGAPLLVDEALLAQANARLLEAAARAASAKASAGSDVGVDEPVAQSTAERWNLTLQHLADKLVDEHRS